MTRRLLPQAGRPVLTALAVALAVLAVQACSSDKPTSSANNTSAGNNANGNGNNVSGNDNSNVNANQNANDNANANTNTWTTVGGDPYPYVAPPATAPAGLETQTWHDHMDQELLPYWRMTEAQGTPVGNFPTYRGMDGSIQGSTNRKVRMLGRQTYAYALGFLMTGDDNLLALAKAGSDYLIAHGWDATNGGWLTDITSTGAPTGNTTKYAQDASYGVMGPAAYFYVSADPAAEQAVLNTRDLLFGKYWDATNGRIMDAMDATLTTERYGDDGHTSVAGDWELVAQLDPITAFLLVSQPQLTDAARRDQMLDDLHRLADLMVNKFWRDGVFRGTRFQALGTATDGNWHTDTGHITKAYWAVIQIDKRLADHPYSAFIDQNAPTVLSNFQSAVGNRWSTGTWWEYAEADQLGAILAMRGDASWVDTVAGTSANFRAHFVDRTRQLPTGTAAEVFSGWDGNTTTNSDTRKCNEWKNGFHSNEHATFMYLFSAWANNTPAQLYFAWPPERLDELKARVRPYSFRGRVVSVEDKGVVTTDGTRHKYLVTFDQIH